MTTRNIRVLCASLLFSCAVSLAQPIPTPLRAVVQNGISSSSTVIDNRSALLRHSTVHTFCANGSGTWAVQIQYSDVSSAGPWTSFTNVGSLVNQSSTTSCVGVGIGFHNFIRFSFTGSATVDYAGTTNLFLGAPNPTSGSGTGDFSSNTSTSVVGEMLVFADTTGKLGKRATTTGILKGTAGVLGAAVADTDYQVPLTFTAPLNRSVNAISIPNAAADGSTKGAAAFTAADFNDNGSGLISIDYTNGQAASASAKGLLISADWTTFNNKQAALTATNDTNVTGSVAGPVLTLGWTGVLAKARIISTAVYNDQSNTFTGTQDFSGATVKMPVSAGCTPTTNGLFCYDSTALNPKMASGSVDNIVVLVPQSLFASINDNDCPKFVKASTRLSLTTTGSACGSGGTGILFYVPVSSGSGTAYAGSPSTCPGSYSTGQVYEFFPDVTNSGTTPTINVCSLGAKTIVHASDGSPLVASELDTTRICRVTYGGTTMGLEPLTCSKGPGWITMEKATSTQVGTVPANNLATFNDSDNGLRPSVKDSSGTVIPLELRNYCADAGSTDAYACTLPVCPTTVTYETGGHYRFKANTLNTGGASINFCGWGAKTIVKVAGGVTTALATNDILAGQIVDVAYDGTNMQMQSLLGNAPSGGGGAGPYLTTYAGRTACSTTAFINFYTNGRYLYGVCNGASVYTDFTAFGAAPNTFPSWTSIGSPTVDTTQGGIQMTTTGGSNVGYKETGLGATFTRTARHAFTTQPYNGGNAGVLMIGVGDGTKCIGLRVYSSAAAAGVGYLIEYQATCGTFTSSVAPNGSIVTPSGQEVCVRVSVDGTNINFYVGDGAYPQLIYTTTYADKGFGTMSVATFQINAGTGVGQANTWLLSWY